LWFQKHLEIEIAYPPAYQLRDIVQIRPAQRLEWAMIL
jgi:hypothetical protein